MGISIRRLQALRRSRLSGSVSDRIDRAYRGWLGARAERCLQWLWLLRGVVPLRGNRSTTDAATRCGWRIQMHILLRPTKEWARSGLCKGLSNRIDRIRQTG